MKGESGVGRSIMEELYSWDIQGDQMEGERGVTRNIIDELHSWNIQDIKRKLEVGLLEVPLMNFVLPIFKEIKWQVKVVLLEDEMEGKRGVSRSIIDEIHSWDIEGNQMEGESCISGSIMY